MNGEIQLEIIEDSGAARSTRSLKQWREIEQRIEGEEWKHLRGKKLK